MSRTLGTTLGVRGCKCTWSDDKNDKGKAIQKRADPRTGYVWFLISVSAQCREHN